MTELSDLAVGNAVVGGDLNCLLNPLVDRFPLGAFALSKQSKQITGLCEDLGYVDVDRTLHPVAKESTFFSSPHKCFTRIDFFFCPTAAYTICCLLFNWKHHNIRSCCSVHECYS